MLVEVDGVPLGMELLPDGLKSILSWVADLLMRLDRPPWENDTPVLKRPFLLFLDKIEVHLHPAWQRKILPAIQGLFPNAQVFVSTHSPFVIASADDTWICPLVRTGPYTTLRELIPSMRGNSYATILREALGIDAAFSTQVEALLDRFYQARDNALRCDPAALKEMDELRNQLAAFGEEVHAVVIPEIRQTHPGWHPRNRTRRNDTGRSPQLPFVSGRDRAPMVPKLLLATVCASCQRASQVHSSVQVAPLSSLLYALRTVERWWLLQQYEGTVGVVDKLADNIYGKWRCLYLSWHYCIFFKILERFK